MTDFAVRLIPDPELRRLARVPEAQPSPSPSLSFSPRKIVCDVPSVMSSNRIALLRKSTPLLLAAIGASTSL